MMTVSFDEDKSIGDFLKELESAYNSLSYQVAELFPQKVDNQFFLGKIEDLEQKVSTLDSRVCQLEIENHDLRQELNLMIASRA